MSGLNQSRESGWVRNQSAYTFIGRVYPYVDDSGNKRLNSLEGRRNEKRKYTWRNFFIGNFIRLLSSTVGIHNRRPEITAAGVELVLGGERPDDHAFPGP